MFRAKLHTGSRNCHGGSVPDHKLSVTVLSGKLLCIVPGVQTMCYRRERSVRKTIPPTSQCRRRYLVCMTENGVKSLLRGPGVV